MRRRAVQITLAAAMLAPLAVAAADKDVNEIFRKGQATWADLLEDTSMGQVAAASMLGVSGNAVATVENTKGLVLAAKGLLADGGKGSVALGITPARTAFAPMDLATYAGHGRLNGVLARIAGASTLGYAQGTAKLSGSEYERRAWSVQTSWYFKADDDPILAVAKHVADNGCPALFAAVPPTLTVPVPGSVPATETEGAKKPAQVDATEAKRHFADCARPALSRLKWNRSLAALSLAQGRIRRSDGSGSEVSMGTAWTANVTIGINLPDGGWLGDGLAITVGHRATRGEPVLATLGSAALQRRDNALSLVRMAGGGDKARLFVEASNARADIGTESQRQFKRALGADMQLAPEVWLNLRAGKQHRLGGGKLETSSLLSLSWSPKALMAVGSGS